MAAIATGDSEAGTGLGFPGSLDLLHSFDKPLLAAVNGVGMGLGCSILGHVDLVLIDEDARLRVPFAEMGVPPEAGSSVLLPARMGWQRAAAALLASEWIEAEGAVTPGSPSAPARPGRRWPRPSGSPAPSPPSHPTPPGRSRGSCWPGGERRWPRPASREEAAFAALFADPTVNPGHRLAADLGD